jgi:hypothetical protein
MDPLGCLDVRACYSTLNNVRLLSRLTRCGAHLRVSNGGLSALSSKAHKGAFGISCTYHAQSVSRCYQWYTKVLTGSVLNFYNIYPSHVRQALQFTRVELRLPVKMQASVTALWSIK